MCKNWDNALEKVEGRLKKWKWILPHMSFRGRTLVINNLVSSMLWHQLLCIDPPTQLLAKVQAILVDFFWDRMHWVPQSVLFLPKEEGGQGLIHLASRGAAFRLQFIQRFLVGPRDLVWRPLARTILSRDGISGLAESLFLMDLSTHKLHNLPKFYQGLFTVWGMFHKQRSTDSESLLWLLKEPVVYGTRFNVEDTMGPFMMRLFVSTGTVTLGHVVNLCGPNFFNAASLASHVGVRSIRVIDQLLSTWKCKFTKTELSLLTDYCNGFCQPNVDTSFPAMTLFPNFKECTGQLLESESLFTNNLKDMGGKVMYKLFVKVLNKSKLNGRVDTPWRAHLGVGNEIKPVWRALYKPPLTKRVGDLQWRILHGIVAVNAFISIVNPNVSAECPFCLQRETIFHCFSDCGRLTALFYLLQRMFIMFGESFSKQMFILGFKYCQSGE